MRSLAALEWASADSEKKRHDTYAIATLMMPDDSAILLQDGALHFYMRRYMMMLDAIICFCSRAAATKDAAIYFGFIC